MSSNFRQYLCLTTYFKVAKYMSFARMPITTGHNADIDKKIKDFLQKYNERGTGQALI